MTTSSVNVSRRIPDIAPTLTLRRDKAYTTYPPNRKRYALPSMEVIQEIDTNYAWSCVPDMSAYKTAIVRNKVCEGLMYLLPGDKNSSSLARPYTTQLGTMFSEPYMNFKSQEYNEENVKQSSDIHFSPNTHITRLDKHRKLVRHPHALNSDSKKSYNDYNALVSKRNRATAEEGGKGNVPVQVRLGDAEIELQHEVQQILDEVDVHGAVGSTDDVEYRPYSTPFAQTAARASVHTPGNASSHKSVQLGSCLPADIAETEAERKQSIKEFRQQHYLKKTAKFKDYKELRDGEVPRPLLPKQLKSQYLSDTKTEEIWKWLNWDFKKSKFEHFIEVCS